MTNYLSSESIIPIFSIKEKDLLSNVYKINNWNDTLNYLLNYKKNDIKYSFERILKFSWISFINNYKDNLNNILEIYKIYFEIKEIKFDENKLKEKIKNIDPNKYDINNIYKDILK